jgi:hypothetical protein
MTAGAGEEVGMDWQSIDSAPENEKVLTVIDDADGRRNEQPMTRRGRLWWIDVGEPHEMYVYYSPTHWRRF